MQRLHGTSEHVKYVIIGEISLLGVTNLNYISDRLNVIKSLPRMPRGNSVPRENVTTSPLKQQGTNPGRAFDDYNIERPSPITHYNIDMVSIL